MTEESELAQPAVSYGWHWSCYYRPCSSRKQGLAQTGHPLSLHGASAATVSLEMESGTANIGVTGRVWADFAY